MLVDLYALDARQQTARYLSTRQRVWAKIIGLSFVAGMIVGYVAAVVATNEL